MLGSAYSELSASTIRMTTYFQRGNSSIAWVPRGAIPGAAVVHRKGSGLLGRLQGTGRQHVADSALLHADAHVVSHFDGDEVVADVGDDAGDAAVGQHFVAALDLLQHGLVLLLPLHLRADHQEVHDGDQDDREQQGGQAHALRLAAGGLGVGGGNQEGKQVHRWSFGWAALRPFQRTNDEPDRKSTRLNSSHSQISYAVFCLKKKKKTIRIHRQDRREM